MIHSGSNEIDGIAVEVICKRIRRINLRVARDGTVRLSVPMWRYPPSEASIVQRCGYRGATLSEGEAFLESKWQWVLKTRAEILSRPVPALDPPVSEAGVLALKSLLAELNDTWHTRLDEEPFSWKIRRVKSVWGCCHWQKRTITYNAQLARAPRELVEYVVVHELTHFKAPNHGPKFYELMDARLP